MNIRFTHLIVLFLAILFVENATTSESKRLTKEEIVADLQNLIHYPDRKELPNVRQYAHLNTVLTHDGKTYTIWRAAIQAALDEKKGVYLPKSDHDIYYLDAPIQMDSGCVIQADPEARIYAVPTLRTCLVRNRNMLPGRIRPVSLDDDSCRDCDLIVTGGIWSQESNVRSESFGASDAKGSIPGSAGVLLFSNVANLSVTRLKVEKGAPFAVHISNAKNVFVSDISVETNCDGIHLNGPLNRAVIQKLDCLRTGDDCIALNAWDWPQSGPALGPINRVLVQDCQSISGSLKDVRLLAGILKYPDGTTIDCPVQNVVIRNITGFNYFKLYAQSPAGAQKTCQIGTIDNVYFDNIKTPLQGKYRENWTKDFYGGSAPFSILSNIKNITFENLTIVSDCQSGHPCVFYVGPESLEFRFRDKTGKALAPINIFMSDASCIVENLELKNIRDGKGNLYPSPEKLVKEIQLSLNPDFPKAAPRGGIGKGTVKKITILP